MTKNRHYAHGNQQQFACHTSCFHIANLGKKLFIHATLPMNKPAFGTTISRTTSIGFNRMP